MFPITIPSLRELETTPQDLRTARQRAISKFHFLRYYDELEQARKEAQPSSIERPMGPLKSFDPALIHAVVCKFFDRGDALLGDPDKVPTLPEVLEILKREPLESANAKFMALNVTLLTFYEQRLYRKEECPSVHKALQHPRFIEKRKALLETFHKLSKWDVAYGIYEKIARFFKTKLEHNFAPFAQLRKDIHRIWRRGFSLDRAQEILNSISSQAAEVRESPSKRARQIAPREEMPETSQDDSPVASSAAVSPSTVFADPLSDNAPFDENPFLRPELLEEYSFESLFPEEQ